MAKNKTYYLVVEADASSRPNEALCYDTLQEAYNQLIDDVDPDND